MRALKSSLSRRFARDTSGAIAVQFGLVCTLLFGVSGGAVDYLRWHSAKRITSASLDAAVLAGARTLQMNPGSYQMALDAATAFYQENAVGKVAYSVNTVNFVMADNNSAVTAEGTAKINTTLLRVVGINELTLASTAGSGFPKGAIVGGGVGGSNLEISLMLDVTGSMCDDGVGPCTTGTKISGLKAAAVNLVDTVIAANQEEYYTKMAIVPFSTRVRVGPNGGGGGMMKALTNLDPVWSGWYRDCISSTGGGGSEGGGNWQCLEYQARQKTAWKVMPCVTDRFNNDTGYDYTDMAAGSQRWLNAHGGDRMTLSWDSSNDTPDDRLGTQSDPATNWNYNQTGECADVANANQIMPLSSDKIALKARINGLEAYGSTSGALGTAWAWYTISPRWHNVFTGTSRPGNYSELTQIQSNGRPALRKVAILMSDGVYNTLRGWKDQDQQTVSNHAKQLCANMKAEGIEIFTVGLELDQLTPGERAIAEDTLQSCGTDLSHFYSTLDVQQLQAAFQSIAYQMSTIRLTW